MRRTLILMLVLVVLSGACTIAYADGPVKKLGRGLTNIVSSPFVMFRTMGRVSDEKGVLAGFTWGVVQGTVDLTRRAVVGVYETATFLVPVPGDYAPILKDPEFFMQKEDYLY